jgi:hypothetical protein
MLALRFDHNLILVLNLHPAALLDATPNDNNIVIPRASAVCNIKLHDNKQNTL